MFSLKDLIPFSCWLRLLFLVSVKYIDFGLAIVFTKAWSNGGASSRPGLKATLSLIHKFALIYLHQCHSVHCLLASQGDQPNQVCLVPLFYLVPRVVLPRPVRETILLEVLTRAVRQHLILPCDISTLSSRLR